MTKSMAVVVLAALLVSGCWDAGRAAADRTLQTIQASYDKVKADAVQYMPEQARQVEETFAAARSRFARGDYMKALADARGLSETVTQLETVLAARKAELLNGWKGLEARVPRVLERLQAQVETLSKAGRLPDGVTRDAVAAARAALPTLTSAWQEAAATFKSANFKDALAKGGAVKARVTELLASLGITAPDDRQ